MAIVPGNAIISDVLDPVMGSMKDVIEMEDHRHILQTDLRRNERLLQYTDIFFRYQQKDPPEMVKIWLQLLLNSLTDAKGLFDRSGQRQSCHDCVVCHPGRLSKEITEWKALFNHIYEAFSTDLFPHIVLSGNAIISRFVDSVMELLKDVIQMEDHRRTLQTDLRPMESLLRDITTLFRDEVDIFTFFQNKEKVPLEIVMTGLQSLRNSLREAECLLSIDRSATRRSCLDCLVRKPKPRRLSKEIRDWNAFSGGRYDGLQSDLSILMTSLQFLQSRPLHIEDPLLQDVAASGLVVSGIVDAQAQLESWLHGGDPVHLIGVYGMPGVGKTSLLKKLCDQVSNVFDRVIWVTVSEYDKMFDLQSRIVDGIFGAGIGRMSAPCRFYERKRELSEYLKEIKFLLVLDDLWSRLDLQELGVAFGAHQHSKVVFSTRRKDLIREMGAEESIEIQPLSRDEAWMLFRRVAFKDDLVSMEIEERTRRFADECRGVPLVINIVAAMIGQTTVHHWDSCFSLMQESVDPSFPATNPRLDAQLYRLRVMMLCLIQS